MLKCSEWVKPSSHVRWFCCRIVGRVTTLAHNPQDYETETFRLSYYNPFRAAEVRHFQQLVESELCKSVFGTSRYKRQRRQGLAQLPNFVSGRLPAASIEYFINWKMFSQEELFLSTLFGFIGGVLTVLVFKLLEWMGEKRRENTEKKKAAPRKWREVLMKRWALVFKLRKWRNQLTLPIIPECSLPTI